MVAKAGLGLTAATVLFARSALASAIDISSTGCVDVSGMNTCLSNAQSKFTSCMTAAGGDDEVSIACQWTEWVNQMLCYQQSCWNKIYSCEYQNLVASYVTAQTTPVSIPYYPAPDNAPGGCSCNIGDVFGNITANTNAAGGGCSKYVDGTSNSLFVCECCGWSAAVSAFYGICPDTSPDALGLSAFDKQAANFEQISGSCAGLTSDICAQYGFESEDNGKFLDPTNLPAGGTNPLSTTAGPSSLTSPPAGETITWALAGQTFVVTAAPYNGKNVAAGATTTGTAASATGTGSGSSTGSSTGSSSGSGSGSGSGSSSGSGSESSGATGTKATATGTTATGTILPSPIKTNAATKIQGLTEAWSVGLLSLIGVAAVL